MSDKSTKDRYWLDVMLKLATPLIIGLVLAWFGFFGDQALSNITFKQESARLLAELQIKREQTESALRKDIFTQALEAFLVGEGKDQGGDVTVASMSKQLLRLELLALNFGESLSLSPLFTEMRRDLNAAMNLISESETENFGLKISGLKKRLDSLAKRVADKQISSLARRGVARKISVPLGKVGDKDFIELDCADFFLANYAYQWPEHHIASQYQVSIADYEKGGDESLTADTIAMIDEDSKDLSQIDLDGITRYLQVNVERVNYCNNSARVQIRIKDEDFNDETDQSFTLDYFNFPMVDNTRLSHSHRFAIVAEDFRFRPDKSKLELVAVIFPAEYASLRDRLGMEEVKSLLESSLLDDDDQSEDEDDVE